MDQQYPSSSQPGEESSKQQHAPRISKKIVLLGGLVVLIFLFFLLSFMLGTQKTQKSVSQTPTNTPPASVVAPGARRWQILLSYNAVQKDLELKQMTIEKGEAAPEVISTSAYKLLVLDKSNKVIYQTPLSITEQVLYDMYYPPSSTKAPSMPKQPRTLDTLALVPYLSNAETIHVTRNDVTLLEFAPLKDDKVSFIPQAFAELGAACKALTVIFLSDGYTDRAKFEADAQRVKDTFIAVPPYNTDTNKAVFNFKVVWNPDSNPLECAKNGTLVSDCVASSKTQLAAKTAAGSAAETAFNKYIILANTTPQFLGTPSPSGDTSNLPRILGTTNGAGGDFVVMPMKEFSAVSAVHEIGGHAIGLLFDRYVNDTDYAQVTLGANKSNCTDNPNGEEGWGGKAYLGCTKSTWYAPAPTADPVRVPSCAGNGGALISAGNPDTVMSAASCFNAPSPRFDAVETAWIASVLSKKYESYAACAARVSTAATPSTAADSPAVAAPSVKSLPPMATKIDECPAKPPAGSPGTLEPGTRDLRYNDNNDPEIFFGHYIDSTNKSDLYFTTGIANIEARWAGSKSRNPANGEYRGMFYVRAGHPNGFQRAGGYVYDPAYDWSTPYGEGHYAESGWSRVMAYTGDAEKGHTDKDRNCILATSVQRLIRDDKNTGKDKEYYTSSKMWYRVATRPAPPASEPNSVIKIHATGEGINGGWYPTMALYIDQYKVKTWKNFGKNPAPGDIYTYPDPKDPADATVRIGKVAPHRVVIGIDDNRFDDESGVGKVNSMVLYGINIDGTEYSSVANTVFRATTYVDKLQSCVAVPGKEFDSNDTGGWFWCGYFWFDYKNAQSDPYTSSTLFKDISADGSKGTGTVSSGSETGSDTTKPSQQYYSCAPDPACKAKNTGVQICALKCSPK